jgi:pilus assembly protein Flp/PilA
MGPDIDRFWSVERKGVSAMLSWINAAIWLLQRDHEDEGQGLVEYGLIIVLVSIAAIGTLTVLGTTISDLFALITGSL